MTPRSASNPSREFVLLIVLPAAILALGTLAFRAWPMDLAFQSSFFDSEGGWVSGKSEPWRFLYHYGTIPALAVAVGALVLLAAGFRSPRLARHRKAAVFLILVMLLGPGLLVNGILKEGWGRPRPREVVDFGGRERFEEVLEHDPASGGKSFPCGHATMGFYFCAFLYLFHREKRKLGWLLAAFGVVLGVLLGIARMAQGGHFASDVLWSWGCVTVVAAGLSYLLGLHRSIQYTPNPNSWLARILARYPTWAIAGIGLVIAGLVIGALAATPYHDTRAFPPEPVHGVAHPASLRLSIVAEKAEVTLDWIGGLSVRTEADGFGLPGSKVKYGWRSETEGDDRTVRLSQHLSGYFAELRPRLNATCDPRVPGRIKIDLRRGDVRIPMPPAGGAARTWNIHLGKGDVRLTLPPEGLPIRVKANMNARNGGAVRNNIPTLRSTSEGLWESVSPAPGAPGSKPFLQRIEVTLDDGDLYFLPAAP